jgi:hypothetical protein
MTAIIYPNIHSLYQAKCAAFDKLAAAASKLCENHEALLADYAQVIEYYRQLSNSYGVITEALHEADVQVNSLRKITGNDALTFFSQEEKIQNLEKQVKELIQYADTYNEQAIEHEETLQDIVDHLVNELKFTPSK